MTIKLLKPGAFPVVDAIATLGAAGLVSLHAYAGLVTSGNYQTFIKEDNTYYQVTAGKTCYIFQILIYGSAANTGPTFIGYGDTSVGNNVSGPTNFIQLIDGPIAPTANTPLILNPWLKIPGGKFLCMKQSAAGATIILLGFEE